MAGWAVLALLLWAGIASAAEGVSGECELLAGPGEVICVRGEERLVRIVHPTLFGEPRRYRGGEEGAYPAGPVRLKGQYFYGVKQELYRFDPARREVLERVRFPAAIDDLSVEGGALRVELVGKGGREEELVLRFEPGKTLSAWRAPWDWDGTLGSWQDVLWLEGVPFVHEPGATTEKVEPRNEDDQRLVNRLEEQLTVQRANPYLALYLGEALERLGRIEEARAAYERAVEHQAADWLDLLRLGVRMEYRGQVELGVRAFERGYLLMEAAGVRGERVTAMVNVAFGALWFRDAVEQALERGDLAQVERLMGTMHRFFPRLEGSAPAYLRMARVVEDGEVWERRAQALMLERTADQVFAQAAAGADLYLALQIGLFITLLLSGAVLGLGRQSQELMPVEGFRASLPRFAVADLVVVLSLLGALFFLPAAAAPRMQVMASLLDAPAAMTGDGMTSPQAQRWLGGLSPGPAARQLLEEAQAEEAALQMGRPVEAQRGGAELLVLALEQEVQTRRVKGLQEVQLSPGAAQDFPWLKGLISREFSSTAMALIVAALFFNGLFLGGMVQFVARRVESVQRWGSRLVVGAPAPLRFLRVPIFASFVVGLVLLSPLGQIAQASTQATLVSYFGLSSVPPAVSALDLRAVAMVLGALLLHGIGVYLDARSGTK